MKETFVAILKRNELKALLVFIIVSLTATNINIPEEHVNAIVVAALAFFASTVTEGIQKQDYVSSLRRFFRGRKFNTLVTQIVLQIAVALVDLLGISLPPETLTYLVTGAVGLMFTFAGLDTVVPAIRHFDK